MMNVNFSNDIYFFFSQMIYQCQIYINFFFFLVLSLSFYSFVEHNRGKLHMIMKMNIIGKSQNTNIILHLLQSSNLPRIWFLIALKITSRCEALKLSQKIPEKKHQKCLPLWSCSSSVYQSFCSCSVFSEELGTGLGMLEPVRGFCSLFREAIISAKLGLNLGSLINTLSSLLQKKIQYSVNFETWSIEMALLGETILRHGPLKWHY